MEEKGSVLIVDDNVDLCTTLSFILKDIGYVTFTANDGHRAIAHVTERAFDMILMDIKMPTMNGVETLRRIRMIRSDAAVVMMTAYTRDDLVQEALKEGAIDVVYKPFDVDKMLSLIEETIEARRCV